MLLNCHSTFSLKYGTIPVDELVEKTHELGYSHLALTDINNTSMVFDFLEACAKKGIKGSVGVEFRNETELLFVAIAQNNQGFYEICQHLSHKFSAATELKLPYFAPKEWQNCWVIYPLDSFVGSRFVNGKKLDRPLGPTEYIGLQPQQINSHLQFIKSSKGAKCVALATVSFLPGKWQYALHSALRAIHYNTLYSKLTVQQTAPKGAVLQAPELLEKTYALAPELLQRAQTLLEKCTVEFNTKVKRNKQFFTSSAKNDEALLKKLAFEGLEYRYGLQHKKAKERVLKELKIIHELGFSAYFLITWDIIRYAQSRGFYHVGRGSGANSIVAYCLKITDVCPIELDLYFERFINPHRTSPPDFDLDFSWDQRDEVIDYMFKRYGAEYTAQIATYNTFKGKSIIRELGKVFGLPKPEIDAFIQNPSHPNNQNKVTQAIVKLGKQMEGFPNYLSIHAGGIIISEHPLNHYTALQMMPKGFPIVHWDMYVAEDIGFYKFDILSQRGLGHIKESVEIIAKNKGTRIDIHQVNAFKTDTNVVQLLENGKALGCFYVESPAMRGLLKKLRCKTYISLVAASSIIRPGVAKSGMMREYIQRFHNPNSIQYLHPVMQQQLEETYGVMIYQEDVIKVAHHFADIDLADADILRRAMSGKFRSQQEMQRIKSTFFNNCAQKGYNPEITQEVWRQIESFSGYSFSKAHSASFAVESFQSLYLKAYFPLEFMVAVINNFGGFYRTEIYVHEARMAGATIVAPCVNNSLYLTSIQNTTIYLGFVHVQSLEKKTVKKLLETRDTIGVFTSLEHCIETTGISLEQIIILIRVGAFAAFGSTKKELLWQAHLLLGNTIRVDPKPTLFGHPATQFTLPPLFEDSIEHAYDEIELLGFPLCSPFDLLVTTYRGDVQAAELLKFLGKTVRMVGYLVTVKPVTTVNNKHMNFGCFIDVEGNFFDTVHFPEQLKTYPFAGKGCYLIQGKVVEEFDFPLIEVEKMAKLPIKELPYAAKSKRGLPTTNSKIMEYGFATSLKKIVG